MLMPPSRRSAVSLDLPCRWSPTSCPTAAISPATVAAWFTSSSNLGAFARSIAERRCLEKESVGPSGSWRYARPGAGEGQKEARRHFSLLLGGASDFDEVSAAHEDWIGALVQRIQKQI